jgi:hypothetical protein
LAATLIGAGGVVAAYLLAAATGNQVSPAPVATESETAAAVASAIADGDAHYARRAEGARGGTALPFHTDGAIVE